MVEEGRELQRRRPLMLPWVRAIALAAPVCVLLLASCARSPESASRFLDPGGPRRTGASLIEIIPGSNLLETSTLQYWNLSNVRWAPEGPPVIWSDHEDPYLWREAIVDTERVLGFRMVVYPRAGWSGEVIEPQLFWSASRVGTFSEDRQVSASGHPMGTEGALAYDFILTGHPEWTGTIGAIRLDLGSFPDQGASAELSELVLLSFQEPGPNDLFNASVGSEERPAWFLEAGARRSLQIDVPAEATLRFGYGRARVFPNLPSAKEVREIRVLAETLDGHSPVRNGASLELTRILLPSNSERWRDVEISLAGLAGRRIRLSFEIDGEPPNVYPANPSLISAVEVESARASPLVDAGLPNVIWIVADTLRADRLSLYGHRRVTSPRIDEWARRRGTTFLHMSPAATWTLPSHVSMLTGLDPPTHGIRFPPDLVTANLPYLPSLLWQAGYSTAAFTGGGFVDPGHGFARGFEQFDSWSGRVGAPEEISTQTRKALRWIDRDHHRPFFLFFHTYETHSPYRARQPHFSALAPTLNAPPDLEVAPTETRDRPETEDQIFGTPNFEGFGHAEGELDLLNALYDSGVAELDRWIGEILDLLETRDLAENTIVVFTSDHGESLGENELFGHGNLDEPNLAIPLVLGLPRRFGESGSVPQSARSVDLVPTLLDLLGLESLVGLDGTSLVPLLKGHADSPRPALITSAWTNRGIAVRSWEDGLHARIGDGIWPGQCGTREFLALDRATGSWRSVDESPQAVRWLNSTGFLDRDHESGLSITVQARGAPAAFRLTSATAALVAAVKWRGGLCPEATLEGETLELAFRRGTEGRLFWMAPPVADSRLLFRNGSPADTVPLEVGLTETDSGRTSFVLQDGIWRIGSPARESEATVVLEWRGPRPAETSPLPAETVRAKLEALGYL